MFQDWRKITVIGYLCRSEDIQFVLVIFSLLDISDCFETPWTVACPVPLSMWFHRQEDWSWLTFPSPVYIILIHDIIPVYMKQYIFFKIRSFDFQRFEISNNYFFSESFAIGHLFHPNCQENIHTPTWKTVSGHSSFHRVVFSFLSF